MNFIEAGSVWYLLWFVGILLILLTVDAGAGMA